jgi:futalosine hydrolase
VFLLAAYATDVEGQGWSATPAVRIGVGMPTAAAAMTRAVLEHKPTHVLLFGVAGAFPDRHRNADAEGLAVGEVCIVGSDRYGDLGVELPGGYRGLAQMELVAEDAFVLPLHLSELGRVAAALDLPVVEAVTVATGSGTEAASEKMARRSRASIETMEGAAVAMVCAAHGIPLLHVRAISNETGDRARGGWDLEGACARARALAEAAAVQRREAPGAKR